MKHLLQVRLQLLGSLFRRILPWRCSFLQFPKTIPTPPSDLSLKRRIEQAHDSAVSITPLLRQWFDSGNQAGLSQLRSIITSLHRSNRFSHALQISEWMCEQQSYNLSSVDFETRLLLIAKVHGLEEAHNFLDSIPLQKRDFYVHYALLNSCKTHASVTIAEATFQKMRDLGLASNSPKAYNTMLCIYHQAANHDMVVKLLGEMDDKDMVPEGVSFNKLLTSYTMSSVYDIQGMERFLNKWKHMMDPWVTFYFPGLLYIGAGSVHKGLTLLRKTEQLVDGSCRKTAYEGLMKVYCHVDEREDVYRLWNLAKDHHISFDSSKCSDIIKAFTRTGHLDEVLEEWDEHLDLGLKDFGLEKRYAKEEAEKVVNMLGKKKSKWESLVQKLTKLVEDEDDREEERMEKVAVAMMGRLHDQWNPKMSMALSAYACVQYVEGRRDVESAANILRLLNKQEQLLHATDKERLSMKMVEAMRGGGYVGGRD